MLRLRCPDCPARPAVLLTLGLLLLAPRPAPAAFSESGWRFYSRIETPYFPREEIVTVQLTSDVFEYAQADGADLRVVDDAGREVPHLLERRTRTEPRTVREACAAQLLSLDEGADNRLEIDYQLAADAAAPTGLTLVTPLKDFERLVSVSGSDDGNVWTLLAHEAPIFDFSRFMDVARSDVSLPANRFRRFRLVIRNVTDQARSPWAQLTRELGADGQARTVTEALSVENRPLRIDRVDFWRTVTREDRGAPESTDYQPQAFSVNREPGRTLLEVTMRREPLTAFTLVTPSRNFSRPVTVEVGVQEGVQTRWREVGRGTWTNLDFRDLRRQELRVSFPEQRATRYRITVADGDSPPLEVRGVRAEGHAYHLAFLAFPARPYRLFYGAPAARAPVYDQVTVLNPLQGAYQAQPVLLARRVFNEHYAESAPLTTWLRSRWFLGMAVAVAVLALGAALYRASRRLGAGGSRHDW